MPNPLTGDFEAVLQVSGGTINRLLASMHQNGGSKTNLPNMPHNAALRIGHVKAVDGLRGTAWAQIAVPRIELIHASTDRFWLEVDIRARYVPDPGTKPLPEFIHGTVRAQYRLEGIDPSCVGWGKLASEFLWIRVVDDTVSFAGTAVDDASASMMITTAADGQAVNARITSLIALLLKTKFEVTPHRVSKRFRRGAMRSLRLGIDQSAVALPIGLSGDPVGGNVDSIDQDLLEGRDFGIAISREFILSRVQSRLDELKASFDLPISLHHKTNVDLGWVDVDVLTVNIDWRVTLTSATADWSGGWVPLLNMFAGVITIKVTGQALTSNPLFNITFDATQLVTVTFDASSEYFGVAPAGPPTVHVQPALYEGFVKPSLVNLIKPQVQAAVGQFASQLDLSTRKKDLIDQLQTLDDQAHADFDEAVFGPDGVIVRGRIYLAARRKPVNVFGMTSELDSFTAFESWIPGGGIARLEWSWSSFYNTGAPGTSVAEDRFLLRRPSGGGLGKFGAVLGLKTLLPGLDGSGSVCLNIRGSQMDPHSGNLVPSASGKQCRRFGLDIHAVVSGTAKRLFIREWQDGRGDRNGAAQEVGLVAVTGSTVRTAASNTLVFFVGERWNADTASVLRDGLRGCRRVDAGLLVLILFRDGALGGAGQELRAELERLAATLEAPIMANEDVQGGWSATFAPGLGSSGEAWRLIAPRGGVTWLHDGPLRAEQLGSALDEYLLPSPPPQAGSLKSRVEPGIQLASTALHPGYADLASELARRCPPLPLRLGSLGSMVAFVQPKSASSQAQLRELGARAAERGEGAPAIVVIVDGVDAREVQALQDDFSVDFITLPDPDGTIANRFGVKVWPTTVTLNRFGVVLEVETGHGFHKLEQPERERERGGTTSQ